MKRVLSRIEKNYTDEYCDDNAVLYSSPVPPGGRLRITAKEAGDYSLEFLDGYYYNYLEEKTFTLPTQDGRYSYDLQVREDATLGSGKFTLNTPSGKIRGLLLRVGESPTDTVGFRIADEGQAIYQLFFESSKEGAKLSFSDEQGAPRQIPTLRFTEAGRKPFNKEIDSGGGPYWYPNEIRLDEQLGLGAVRLSAMLDPYSTPVPGNGAVGLEIVVDPS